MKGRLVGILFTLSFVAASAQKSTSIPRPKLVVGIVIDQMRWDYLYRYYDRYQANGFKRLLNEGFSCENTYINYLPSYTAVGHSTIYTGSVPAIHGMTGNDFVNEATGKSIYCTDDSTVFTVGSSSKAGKMSPRNLLTSTIGDELRLSNNFKSKVIGISLKDRGCILPAGHTANAAYWFDVVTGTWITSTYYMKDLPAWVKKVNAEKLPEKYLKQNWNTLYDLKTYVQSLPPDNPYSGKYPRKSSAFEVETSEIFTEQNYDIIRYTPYGNTITLDLAKEAIENEQLGKNGVTDFLAVSCSSTDLIGHKMGLLSIEIEDTYLRLDRDLANFFTYLDAKVGKGSYTVFLTADHGAGYNPNFLSDNKIPAGYWISAQSQKQLNALLEAKYNAKNIVTSYNNYQVHLNNILVAKNKLDEEAIKIDIINFLKADPVISFVADNTKVGNATLPEDLKIAIQNSYNAKRSGVISFFLQPGWYSGAGATGTGTTHGAWNPYDTHIPLVWMGWGVKHGSSNKLVHMTDIAPTLAAMLHIQVPNGNVGVPIEAIVK